LALDQICLALIIDSWSINKLIPFKFLDILLADGFLYYFYHPVATFFQIFSILFKYFLFFLCVDLIAGFVIAKH
jgi:hypothetical protein